MGRAALVLQCADTECARTLTEALCILAPVAGQPPADAPWGLIAHGAAPHSLAPGVLPPSFTLWLGAEAAEPAGAGRMETVSLPVRLEALVAQVRRLMEAPAGERLPLVAGGAFHLDRAGRCLVHAATGREEPLTEKETQLLEALALASPASVSREELLADVWAYQPEVATRTLETHLSRLRAKLHALGGADVAIVPENGGWRIMPVS